MRKRMTFLSLLVLVLVLGGLSVAAASGPADHYSTVAEDISDLNNISPIPGSSAHLVTNDRGATLQVNTSGLTPGHALTVWWVIFNYPENCTGGECGLDDAFPPPGNVEAGASVSFAAGHVIGDDGQGNFGAHISVGGDAAPWTVGLLEPRTAEVHFVLRDHGPAIPELVQEQIRTAGGGCNNIPPFTGSYTCVDVQAGRFSP
ncbi:MAG: hypothetical protein R3300_12415 [Candidatus Promineifilaceae bacterium]|nr:hypothetical protein [Candidatus Promineifilaceae bacterium]